MHRILSINPGSTSTKIALYEDEQMVFVETIRHSSDEIAQFAKIVDQYEFRRDVILRVLAEKGVDLRSLQAVVGRGGALPSLPGGVYRVNARMLEQLRHPVREHVSNLGAFLAKEIADQVGVPSFIVDPPAVDEMEPIARISGLPEIKRQSLSHALNLKAAARKAAKHLDRPYEDLNLVVVHMGGGISVSPHRKGRMVDANQALDGTGPFSPERAGGLPIGDLARIAYSGKYTYDQLWRRMVGGGGLVAHLGTNDAREVERRIAARDEHARKVYEAMAYQTAKEIGAMAVVLEGRVDAIVLTGGLAHSRMLTGWIRDRVEWIAPVLVFPGEDEMEALTLGALRVLRGEEQAKEY